MILARMIILENALLIATLISLTPTLKALKQTTASGRIELIAPRKLTAILKDLYH